MSSYLTPIDYSLWILFTVIEVVLFLRLTAIWLKPVKFFMLYAAIRDVILLGLTPKPFFPMYFKLYWLGQMVSLIWFSYIARKTVERLAPNTPKILTWLPTFISSVLCTMCLNYLYNPSSESIPKLLTMQTHCTLISVVSIIVAAVFKLNKMYSNMILATACLTGTGWFTVWAWQNLGYQSLTWELSWVFALTGVAVAAKSLPQQPPLLVHQRLVISD